MHDFLHKILYNNFGTNQRFTKLKIFLLLEYLYIFYKELL